MKSHSLLFRLPSAFGAAVAVFLALAGTVQAQSFSEWLARPDVPDGQRTAASIPAGDGVTNLMKFALGVAPMQSAAAHLPQPVLITQSGAPRTLALDFTMNPQAQGLSYALEVSDNLATWTEAPSSMQLLGIIEGTVLTRQRLSETTPPAAVRRFARLKVALLTQPPAGFALIPGGTFTMGDSLDGDPIALPMHSVTLPTFYMAKTLTTWAEWQRVRTWAAANGYSDLAGVGAGKADDHPVQTVTWYDVVKWSNAKSEMEGLTPCYYINDAQTTVYRTGSVDVSNAQVKWIANGYRLPTEAEWEYAARGGLIGRRFPWGDTISHTQANYCSIAGYAYDVSATRSVHPIYNDGTLPYTSPVDAFAANGYGLYDMAGNLWQWCGDLCGIYDSAAQTSPQGPDSGFGRVVRGGYWGYDAAGARSADRGNRDPHYCGYNVGFRCARSSVP
jgi:formylglycine-generating enzyme required for sulfatase activity